jgi:hypothetical protein
MKNKENLNVCKSCGNVLRVGGVREYTKGNKEYIERNYVCGWKHCPLKDQVQETDVDVEIVKKTN